MAQTAFGEVPAPEDIVEFGNGAEWNGSRAARCRQVWRYSGSACESARCHVIAKLSFLVSRQRQCESSCRRFQTRNDSHTEAVSNL